MQTKIYDSYMLETVKKTSQMSENDFKALIRTNITNINPNVKSEALELLNARQLLVLNEEVFRANIAELVADKNVKICSGLELLARMKII